MRQRDIVQKIRDERSGFTLVELIVCVLIMSLVAIMLVTFVRVSVNSYTRAEGEAALQESASTATAFIRDILTEASAVGSRQSCAGQYNGQSHTGTCLRVDSYDGSVGLLVFDDTDGCIYYHRCEGGIPMSTQTEPDYNAAAAGTFGNRYELLAENYKRWNISGTGRLVSMTLVFEDNILGLGDVEYETTLKCECKNID